MTVTWWIDGRLVPADRATVPADDHGLVVGDGVFETLRIRGGAPFAIRRHLARLRRSADGLGLTIDTDDDALRHGMAAVVAASGLTEGRLRLTVTGGRAPLGSGRGEGGPTVLMGVEALGAPAAPAARVAVVPWRRNEHAATTGLKTTSYAENVIALAWARRRGADEAIFANTAGRLCEGTGSNVFVVVDGQVLTPPLTSGCLAGVTRELVLTCTDAIEADLASDVLTEAQEAFLTSTMRDVKPIAEVDGRRLGGDGVRTAAVAAAFADLVAAEADP